MSGGRQRRQPWVVIHQGRFLTRAGSRRAAQNAVDRRHVHSFRVGYCRIYHERTGEEWERRFGSWFKNAEPAREVVTARTSAPAPAAEPDDTARLPWWNR